MDDGRDFIEDSRGGYDLIILDSFDADSIPRHLATLEFLAGVRKALAPAGIAVANVWGRTTNPLYAHMLLTYRAAFAAVYVFDVPVAVNQDFRRPPKPAGDDSRCIDPTGAGNLPTPRVRLQPWRRHRRL